MPLGTIAMPAYKGVPSDETRISDIFSTLCGGDGVTRFFSETGVTHWLVAQGAMQVGRE